MEKNQEAACPICGRPLRCFDGGVGKCPLHSWMPISPEFEERALELKHKEIEKWLVRSEFEARALECQRKPGEPRRSILPLVIVAAIAVVILAVLIFLLFLR